MNYGIILAGGNGKRFDVNLPKQFHILIDKPILIHTIEKFINYEEEIKIVIVIGKDYLKYAKELINNYLPNDFKKIDIVEGGITRINSLINACNYITRKYKINDEDIIITHDAARPFINNRIIRDNINGLSQADGVTTVIESHNAILEVDNNNNVVDLPIRENMKLVQTPQSFRLKEFIENYNTLTKQEIDSLVEATKTYILRNKKIKTIKGELYNIKITTKYDLEMAKNIINKLKGD